MANEPWIFVKYGKKEHLQKLQLGQLYCGTTKYYRDMENKSMSKGRGDHYEGCRVLKDVETKIDGIKMPNASEVLIARNIDDITPIFCFSWYCEKDFIQISANKYKFNLSEKHWTDILTNFGNYALVIYNTEQNNFIRTITTYFKKKKINVIAKPIEYFDYSSSNRNWYSKYKDGDMNLLFMKDKFFCDQHEARFAFDSIFVKKNNTHISFDTNINFSNVSFLCPVQELKERNCLWDSCQSLLKFI